MFAFPTLQFGVVKIFSKYVANWGLWTLPYACIPYIYIVVPVCPLERKDENQAITTALNFLVRHVQLSEQQRDKNGLEV